MTHCGLTQLPLSKSSSFSPWWSEFRPNCVRRKPTKNFSLQCCPKSSLRWPNLAKSLSDQLCQLSGGPCVYKGPDMKTAHADRDTTRAQFNALVEVLQVSMDARGIPFTRQNQLLALLAPMHRDVVNTR